MRQSRRDVLRLFGGATVGGLAGCSAGDSSDPTDEERTPTASQTSAQATLPEWTKWVPGPAAFGLDAEANYPVLSFDIAGFTEFSEALPSTQTDGLDQQLGVDGLGTYGEQERMLRITHGLRGFIGPHDTDRIRTALEDDGYTKEQTVNELDIYVSDGPERRRTRAVGSGVFFRPAGGLGYIRAPYSTILSAVARDDERLPTAVPEVRTTLETVAPGEVVAVRANTPYSATVDWAGAEGFSWRLGSEQTTVTAAFAGDVEADAVRSWAAESELFGAASPSVSTDDSTVEATGRRPTGDLETVSPDWSWYDRGGPPDAQWSFEYDPAASLLTVTHNGGDAIDASEVYIQGDGFTDAEGAAMTEAGQWAGSVSSDSDVTPGDSVTVGATAAATIIVRFESVKTDEQNTMDAWVGPDA